MFGYFLSFFGLASKIRLTTSSTPRQFIRLSKDGDKIQTTLEEVLSKCPSLTNSYYIPTPWLFGGHMQTIWCTISSFSYQKKYKIEYSRKQIVMPDGGTISLDFTPPIKAPSVVVDSNPITNQISQPTFDTSLPDDAPILIMSHGLTGGSSESYILDVIDEVKKNLNWRAVVVNFRGCAGTPVTGKEGEKKILYHGGQTKDLESALLFISNLYPNAPLYGAGFSLGANSMAKHLGESPESVIKGAVIIGCPWNFYSGHVFLSSSYIQFIYSKVMAGNLRALFTSHLYAFEKDERLDLDAILNNPNQTLYEFDCVVTRVLGGFNSTEHYYRSVSADQFAKNISCPLLSISASDDPIVDYKTVPVGLAENNPNLVFCKTKGGHLGHFTGLFPRRWIGKPTVEFLREISEADPAAKIARPIKSLADGMTVAADDETVGFKEVRVTLLEGATALIRGL